MEIVSLHMPENVGLSVSEQPTEIPTPEKSPVEADGYRKTRPKADAVEKFHRPKLGKRSKPNPDASGVKRLFKF